MGWGPWPTSAGRSSVHGAGTWSGDSHGSRAFSAMGTGTYSGAAMEQGIHDRVEQGLPRRFDDVLAHADRAPCALAVSGIQEHPGHRASAGGAVDDADLEVHEVDPVELRVAGRDGGTEGAVDGIDGTVALGRGDDALAVDVHLHRGLGEEGAVRQLVGDHPHRLDGEEVLLPPRRTAHQELERGIGRFEVIALVLEALQLVDDGP